MNAATLAFLERWHLQPDGAPFETPSSWLCYVRRGSQRCVLKVYKPGSDEVDGTEALRHFGPSAVRVLECTPRATLLERAEPGMKLAGCVDIGDDDGATHVLCDLMLPLHAAPLPAGPWRRIEDWGKAFARIRAKGSHSLLTGAVLDHAEAEFFALCATQAEPRLLHGDLHHMNVVLDMQRGWLVIDPKGIIGEPAYETGAALRNPQPRVELYGDSKIMARRVEIFAQRLALNPMRILRWAYAQAVLSAAWHVEDGGEDVEIMNALYAARTARALLGG